MAIKENLRKLSTFTNHLTIALGLVFFLHFINFSCFFYLFNLVENGVHKLCQFSGLKSLPLS